MCLLPALPAAASFAVAMARRRKSEEVEPADLLLYLERTWWAGGLVGHGQEAFLCL